MQYRDSIKMSLFVPDFRRIYAYIHVFDSYLLIRVLGANNIYQQILFYGGLMKYLILFLSLGSIVACSGTAEKEVEMKVAAEKGVGANETISNQSTEIIKNSTKITEEQKTKLLTLHDKTRTEVAKIKMEMGKLKGAFFKTLVSDKKNNAEINVMKKKMTTLHGKQLELMLKSLDEAKVILGDVNEPDLFETFMFEESPHSIR